MDEPERHPSSRVRQAELLLLSPPPRPVRTPYTPTRNLSRRPGERREPLPQLKVSPLLSGLAAARSLDIGCAIELCLERALVKRDLAEAAKLALYPRLLAIADNASIGRALPSPKASYLQMLLVARGRSATLGSRGGTGDVVVDVPLRLFPRVLDAVDEMSAASLAQLDEALRLEIAAASDGRTMSEWAAVTALALSR